MYRYRSYNTYDEERNGSFQWLIRGLKEGNCKKNYCQAVPNRKVETMCGVPTTTMINNWFETDQSFKSKGECLIMVISDIKQSINKNINKQRQTDYDASR